MHPFNIPNEMIDQDYLMGAKPLKTLVIPNSNPKSESKTCQNKKHLIPKIQTTNSNNVQVAFSAAPSMDVMLCKQMDDD